MAKLKQSIGGQQHSVAAIIEHRPTAEGALEMRRQRRLAALEQIAGL